MSFSKRGKRPIRRTSSRKNQRRFMGVNTPPRRWATIPDSPSRWKTPETMPATHEMSNLSEVPVLPVLPHMYHLPHEYQTQGSDTHKVPVLPVLANMYKNIPISAVSNRYRSAALPAGSHRYRSAALPAALPAGSNRYSLPAALPAAVPAASKVSTLIFKEILKDFVELRNTHCESSRGERSIKAESDLTLDDIMCEFSTAYVPEPVAEQMQKNGSLVNGRTILGNGVNGIVVDSGVFKGNPLVTKLTIKNYDNYIYEIVVNMIIINNILLSGKASGHLIPTYGLFKCPKQVTRSGQTIRNIEVCNEGVGTEDYFLVQRKITGNTLRSLLPTLPVDALEDIVAQILSILIILEESEYRLNHNDLHTENIMISRLADGSYNVYIIDMGQASFQYKDKFVIQSSIEKNYLGDTRISLGAFYDINFLFRDIINQYPLKDAPFIKLLDSVVSSILSLFAINHDKSRTVSTGLTLDYIERLNGNPYWLFDFLYRVEYALNPAAKKMVHDHNINILKLCTTRSIVNAFFPPEYQDDILKRI